jgi:hypothetical protein
LSAPELRPKLDGVTLVAVTSVALPATVAALRQSMRHCDFAEVLLLSDCAPTSDIDDIEWREIDRIGSRSDYSRFMLRDLAGHIRTSHALCVQWDGFVLNGGAWRREFLDYDYVGAVWPQFADNYRVGNGGFSLRSSRLLNACKALPLASEEAEDIVIGRRCRRNLEAQGIRFAPEELAQRFAYERTKPTGREFGFHGAFNLVNHVSEAEAAALLGSLETSLLAPNECAELIRWALFQGRFKLALNLLARRPWSRRIKTAS